MILMGLADIKSPPHQTPSRFFLQRIAVRPSSPGGISRRPFSISFCSKTVRPLRAAPSAGDNPALTRSSRRARPPRPAIRCSDCHDPQSATEVATQNGFTAAAGPAHDRHVLGIAFALWARLHDSLPPLRVRLLSGRASWPAVTFSAQREHPCQTVLDFLPRPVLVHRYDLAARLDTGA
jgi:hypothetical protein